MPAGAASIPGSGAAGAAYAHSPGPDGRWQPLEEHLRRVAELAREFGEPFGAGDLAYVLGLWHDLGKVNPAFQRYLRAAAGGVRVDTVPHAIWGAAFAYRVLRAADASAELILPVLGHHAGLSNAGTVGQTLEAFLDEHPDLVPLVAGVVRSLPTVPKKLPPPRSSTRRELFLRMAFSCLVDADYLDTEGHFNPSQAERRGVPTAVEQLRDLLLANQQDLIARAASTSMPTVTRVRREVYESCLLAAAGPQGIYRLTVPTGGGKTRSGLAFALEHAVRHGLRRVVVALPYTSIIDQTAAECRRIFGDAAVLEHYSQAPIFESEAEDPTTARLRVATENWDATLIVTTTVQLFESLFTRRPGRARRLHRLARSVIILDEVQALPPHLLRPTLDVLRTLVEEYGVTVVLSTATQPAFAESRALDVFSGCQIHEIVPDYPTHFDLLRRVDFEVRPNPVPWEAVAAELRARDQVMVVLNTRRDATALLDQFDDAEEVCHLSSLLCGAHRRVVLARIRDRLAHGSPVRLVSTQVVEAGVDIDFPVVWRALGPLDRIIQAAGRCNREGRRERGLVIVFEPEGLRVDRTRPGSH